MNPSSEIIAEERSNLKRPPPDSGLIPSSKRPRQSPQSFAHLPAQQLIHYLQQPGSPEEFNVFLIRKVFTHPYYQWTRASINEFLGTFSGHLALYELGRILAQSMTTVNRVLQLAKKERNGQIFNLIHGCLRKYCGTAGDANIIEAVLNLPEHVDVEMFLCDGRDGDSLVHMAALNGHSNVVRTIINWAVDHRLDLRKLLRINEDAMLCYSANVSNAANVNDLMRQAGRRGSTLLHLASYLGSPDFANDLFWSVYHSGLDPMRLLTPDVDGNTALHVASCYGHADVVRVILNIAYSLDLNPSALLGTNVFGNTAVHEAVISGHMGTVRTILWFLGNRIVNAGHLMNPNNAGASPIDLAFATRREDIFLYILTWICDHLSHWFFAIDASVIEEYFYHPEGFPNS